MSDSKAEGRFDIIVIGAGIAGVSVAAECAKHAGVLLLETESHPATHSTGRSAAYFAPAYGNAVVRGITQASEAFFRAPPTEYFSTELLRPRDSVFIAGEDQRDQLAQMQADVDVLQPVSVQQLSQAIPLLRPGRIAAALRDTSGGDLDVDLIVQGYLRQFRAFNGTLITAAPVRQMHYRNGLWQLDTERGDYSAPTVVNAGGAWADKVVESAGLSGLGITPKRRTAVLVDPPEGVDIGNWPLTVDVDEAFYFKPDAGQLLLSPADETPSEACDAQAEEWDVALAVDRVTQVLDLPVKRINHCWAGLRSFAPDKHFVVGEDPRASGFFWMAGQGGYGVQAAPGLAMLATHWLTGATLDESCQGLTAYADAVNPARLVG